MKKIIALVLAMLMVFLLASCFNGSGEEETTTEKSSLDNSAVNNEPETEVVTKVVTNDEGETEVVTEIIEVEVTEKDMTKKPTEEKTESTTKKPVASVSKDPSDWNMEQVVAYYKKACENSSHVTSRQTMVMRKDSLKAAGGLGKFLSFAEGIIRGVMKLNAIDVPGITGGHWDLTVSDCKTAKAYKSGKYVVVEMTMKDQTDGVYGKTFEGTVGHAISVVNGVAEVAEQFSQFDVRYKEADIKIHYTDAVVKVKINENDIIEKGTWKYVCTPVINDLYIEGIEVDDAGAVIDYEVTLNGGF